MGINAHVNYDLPQAMLSVISPAEFDDQNLVDSRRRDHERIDDVIASRVKDEDNQAVSRIWRMFGLKPHRHLAVAGFGVTLPPAG